MTDGASLSRACRASSGGALLRVRGRSEFFPSPLVGALETVFAQALCLTFAALEIPFLERTFLTASVSASSNLVTVF